MTKTLVTGATYAVTSATTCTVTDANGLVLCTAEPGSQAFFVATTPAISFSDPAAVVTATFNAAPAKLMALGLLGGGAQTLPAGYIAAEFIFVNKTVSNVPIFTVSPDTPEAKLEVVLNMPADVPSAAIFVTSDTKQFGIALYAPWSKDLRWQYGGSFEYGGAIEFDKKHKLKKVGRFNYVDGELVYTNVKTSITATQIVRLASASTPWFYLYSLKCDNTKDEKHEYIPALTPEGSPCLYDKVADKPYILNWTVGFTLPQARQLSKLPATGGTLTISLPSNWQEDTGVVNALATAEANGWVLTYQTYEADASAASTFALRRIFVRKTQDENGQYVDADGSRWHVEWCAGMIGAEPTDHGYEPFRNVDSAVAYWELTPWVDPEQEELLTNSTTNEHE